LIWKFDSAKLILKLMRENMTNQAVTENTKKVHRANLLKSLEHRLAIARAKGETALINKLEAEKRYYLE
jgi:hypothetical protein